MKESNLGDLERNSGDAGGKINGNYNGPTKGRWKRKSIGGQMTKQKIISISWKRKLTLDMPDGDHDDYEDDNDGKKPNVKLQVLIRLWSWMIFLWNLYRPIIMLILNRRLILSQLTGHNENNVLKCP